MINLIVHASHWLTALPALCTLVQLERSGDWRWNLRQGDLF